MSTGSSDLSFAGGGRVRPLTIRRSARARRLTLAVDPRDGTVRLTVPERAALAPAIAWAREKRGWIEAALAALPAPAMLGDGAILPFRGQTVTIRWRPDLGRAVRLDHGVLHVGGPIDLTASRILRWLRAEAAALLEAETRAMATRHGITVGRVGIGDPRTRWGSCSAAGDIRYSWRLILAPDAVRQATVAHELAHRLHMDHSPAFHGEAARLFGRDPAPERAWLRAHGTMLQALGRAG